MKKFLAAMLSFVILLTFAFFAVASGDSDDEEKTQEPGSAVVNSNTDNAKIGDYKVEIKEVRLAKDYEGKDTVIVKYSFTNNSDEAAAFDWTFDHKVYQNGVSLEPAYVLDDSANYDESSSMKEIKKGVTLEVEEAYILNDTVTDIDVEVSELISFDDTTVSRTFSIK